MQADRLPYKFLAVSSLCALILGCTHQGYTVIAASNTTIGIGLSEQPANGSLDATLGYRRQELALIPTNRLTPADQAATGGQNAQGAKDTGNVIMEIRQAGMFSTSENSGIYQRLAVGDIAVQQKGAALMFAKGHNGDIDAATAQALVNMAALPRDKPNSRNAMVEIMDKYLSCQKAADTACINRMNAAATKIDPNAKKLSDIYNKQLTDEQIEILQSSIQPN